MLISAEVEGESNATFRSLFEWMVDEVNLLEKGLQELKPIIDKLKNQRKELEKEIAAIDRKLLGATNSSMPNLQVHSTCLLVVGASQRSAPMFLVRSQDLQRDKDVKQAQIAALDAEILQKYKDGHSEGLLIYVSCSALLLWCCCVGALCCSVSVQYMG